MIRRKQYIDHVVSEEHWNEMSKSTCCNEMSDDRCLLTDTIHVFYSPLVVYLEMNAFQIKAI